MAKRNLTRDEILKEAMDLLDAEGLEGLSMRKLATRLRVQAPTLYYHFPDKSALLNEVLITLFGRVFERMPECPTWQEWMREFGKAIWDVQREAPYAPLLILNTQVDEAHYAKSVDFAVQKLVRYDADQEQLFFIQAAIQAVVTGWSLFASSTYADKMARTFDLHESAISSVEALIEGWADKVGKPQARKAV